MPQPRSDRPAGSISDPHWTPALNAGWSPPILPPGAHAAEAIGSPDNWGDPELDYPREAKMRRSEGTATVGFMIDENGRAQDCLIVTSSGDSFLDTGSCAFILARGRFKPARSADGQFLRSGTTLPIRWSLG